MGNDTEDLLGKALALKPEDRFALVEGVLQSLDAPDRTTDDNRPIEAEKRLMADRVGKPERGLIKRIAPSLLAFVLGVVLCYILMRHNNTVLYDATIKAHVYEAIVNAEQIRRGESTEVLSRTDEWLRSERIEQSLEAFMTSTAAKKESMGAIENYRAKYEPVEAPDRNR